MDVALQCFAFATDHERQFSVGLQTDHAVDHVNAGLVEFSGPLDVVFLVKPRFQFDQRRDLFALFSRADQRRRNRRLGPVRYRQILIATTSGSSTA